MKNAKLVFLAAGRGLRLGSMTESVPKCLNLFEGKSLIEHLIVIGKNCGIELSDMVIVGGYKSELLVDYGVTVIRNENWEKTGPYASLKCASSILSENSCIVSYTDILYSSDFLLSCIDSKDDIYLPSNHNFQKFWFSRTLEILDDIEKFKVNDGVLVEIGGRPREIGDVEGQFAGLVKLTPCGWNQISQVAASLIEESLDITGLLSVCISRGILIKTKQVIGAWREFDIPSDFSISQTELT